MQQVGALVKLNLERSSSSVNKLGSDVLVACAEVASSRNIARCRENGETRVTRETEGGAGLVMVKATCGHFMVRSQRDVVTLSK